MNISVATKYTNNFQNAGLAIEREVHAAVKEASARVVEEAKRLAPVDTGFLRESIYAVLPHSRGGAFRQSIRRARTKADRDFAAPPSIAAAKGTYIIVAGATYAEHVEYGTSRMAARPFLTPAVEGYRSAFEKSVQDAIDRAISRWKR